MFKHFGLTQFALIYGTPWWWDVFQETCLHRTFWLRYRAFWGWITLTLEWCLPMVAQRIWKLRVVKNYASPAGWSHSCFGWRGLGFFCHLKYLKDVFTEYWIPIGTSKGLIMARYEPFAKIVAATVWVLKRWPANLEFWFLCHQLRSSWVKRQTALGYDAMAKNERLWFPNLGWGVEICFQKMDCCDLRQHEEVISGFHYCCVFCLEVKFKYSDTNIEI